jgi:hypothetical protein
VTIEARMVHSCRLITGTTTTTTGAPDEYGGGNVTVSPTYETIRCLFTNEKGGTARLESGELVSSLPVVILPASTTITEGDELTGLSPGWTRSYIVRKIYPIYRRAIDHIRADLETKRS